MPSIPLYQVDAFTKKAFAGNPAAVCPLDSFFDDELLRKIAAENNLSETAFFTPDPTHPGDFALRWFTPAVEVDLCGHATLASAFVLMTKLEPRRTSVTFHTKRGALHVHRNGDAFTLDFPALHISETPPSEAVVEALGAKPEIWLVGEGRGVAVFSSSEQIRSLVPSAEKVASLPGVAGVAVTARGSQRDADVDFVSRYFAPAKGVIEDPVTGSAHCALAPYWGAVLREKKLRARQVSARGGEILCALEGSRVHMTGHAVLTVEGTMSW